SYSGRPDGTEQASYRLHKGGVRALTGMIGKRDPQTYKVHTSVATIGIRGTGHNTRICQGDCRDKPDGLYHNTWEGTTYVVNDVDSEDVPTGRGVYVPGPDKPIQPLDQPPGVTAVDTGEDLEEEHETGEERVTTFAAGDQRDEEGHQTIVLLDGEGGEEPGSPEPPGPPAPPEPPGPPEPEPPVTGSTLLAGLTVVDTDTTPGHMMFLNGDGKPVGSFLEVVTTDTYREIMTIDIDAMLEVDDPAMADLVREMVDAVPSQGIIDGFRQNPAQLVEFGTSGELSWGRWANGLVLFVGGFVSQGMGAQNLLLENFQSLHFIYGPEATSIPTAGSAVYEFVGGTQSTSLSGDSIGPGVTSGEIVVNFSTSTADLGMEVTHASIDYTVQGQLIDVPGVGFFGLNGTASTQVSTSGCNPGCSVNLHGSFMGPNAEHIGIIYEVGETEAFRGAAGFSRNSGN